MNPGYPILEAAMCLWEAVMEAHPDGYDILGGAGNARYLCALRAPDLYRGFTVADQCHPHSLDGQSFDWDFTPWFLENCLTSTLDLVPDWLDLCRTYGETNHARALLRRALDQVSPDLHNDITKFLEIPS